MCEDAKWCGDDRIVEEFVMEQPIPPYLFAFAIGELGLREVGPRTRVYSEAAPTVLDAAAREFAETEEMIKAGEGLFGPYDWERFDLLVLPPSFPYGGMENPRMVFLTPTLIKGDASGAQVVAHELAHSWTGNLITNKNNNHFWLNEVLFNSYTLINLTFSPILYMKLRNCCEFCFPLQQDFAMLQCCELSSFALALAYRFTRV